MTQSSCCDSKQELTKSLKANEKLKSENDSLRIQLNNVAQELELSKKAKLAIEKQCQQLYAQWGQEAAKFEELQSLSVPSREVETLRMQIAEELDLPHRQQLDQIRTAKNQVQEHLSKEHAELEMLRTKSEQKSADYKQNIEELMLRHKAAEDAMLKKIRTLEEKADHRSCEEKLRAALIGKSEATSHEKQSAEEAEQLRLEKEKAVFACEQTKLSHMNDLHQLQTKFVMLDKELQSTKSKHDMLQNDLSKYKQQLSAVEEKRSFLEQNNLNLERLLESSKNHFKELKIQCERRVEEIRNQSDEEKQKLQRTVQALQLQATELTRVRAELHDNILSLQNEQALALQQMKDEAIQREKQNETEKENLTFQIRALEKAKTESDHSSQQQIDRLNHSLETATAVESSLQHERDCLKEKVAELMKQSMRLQDDHTSLLSEYRELSDEYEQLQSKYREMIEKVHSTNAERERCATELTRMKDELRHTLAELETERKNQIATAQLLKDEAAQERSVLKQKIKQIEAETMRQQNVSNETVNTLKKEKSKYKRLAQMLKGRLASLMKEMATLKSDQNLGFQAQKYQNEILIKQVQEVEKQRDDLKARLQAGVTPSSIVSTRSLCSSCCPFDSSSTPPRYSSLCRPPSVFDASTNALLSSVSATHAFTFSSSPSTLAVSSSSALSSSSSGSSSTFSSNSL
eukprot:TRINITY_DN1389_c0_g1_i1.p1 TRINITY_DN1389_c0_g1~~TRINITY_DN1389_c0_g1_i1.p1  ORF type:complete len:691 (+),score=190.70 TRINITY_DN1389_c0_g1_i1:68-2140(+)